MLYYTLLTSVAVVGIKKKKKSQCLKDKCPKSLYIAGAFFSGKNQGGFLFGVFFFPLSILHEN